MMLMMGGKERELGGLKASACSLLLLPTAAAVSSCVVCLVRGWVKGSVEMLHSASCYGQRRGER